MNKCQLKPVKSQIQSLKLLQCIQCTWFVSRPRGAARISDKYFVHMVLDRRNMNANPASYFMLLWNPALRLTHRYERLDNKWVFHPKSEIWDIRASFRAFVHKVPLTTFVRRILYIENRWPFDIFVHIAHCNIVISLWLESQVISSVYTSKESTLTIFGVWSGFTILNPEHSRSPLQSWVAYYPMS